MLWPIEAAVHSRDVEQRLLNIGTQLFRMEQEIAAFSVGGWPVSPDVDVPNPVPTRGGRVLIYGNYTLGTVIIQEAMIDLGVSYDLVAAGVSLPHTIDNYGLVFVRSASDPSWWSTITGGSWAGRVVVAGNPNSATAENIWASAATPSMSLTFSPTFNPAPNTFASHGLTTGIGTISGGTSVQVNGGSYLIRANTGPRPWVSYEDSGYVQWILTGNIGVFDNLNGNTGSLTTGNRRFAKNLWTEPTP